MKKIKKLIIAALIIAAILWVQNDEYKTILLECKAWVRICNN